MEFNVGTILFTIFNALLIFVYLKKKLFVPITNFMDNRTNTVQGQIKDAETKLVEAEALKAEYQKAMLSAEANGKKVVEEYKEKASKLSDEMLEEAKKEANLIRERSKIDAEREKEKAQDEIRRQIVTLSLLAASKAVGAELDDEKHHVLIKEFISKVGV